MDLLQADDANVRAPRTPVPLSDIDAALTAQLIVAWAGEAGDERRLGWWRSDMLSEFGGHDLFARLLPATWRWAVLQAAREGARRRDAELRRQDHNPDGVVSLFCFGFELDERIDERLSDFKRAGAAPVESLPGLAFVYEGWSAVRFAEWVAGHGDAEFTSTPIGRRLKGPMPGSLDLRVRKLVAGLGPLVTGYPLPHFRATP